MAINYSAPRVLAPTIATTPSSFNVNELLGLRSSPYQGLQQVGNQNLYYGDGGFYESYSPSPRQYGRTSYGIWSPMPSWYGIPYQPSYNPIYGYGGGITARGGDVAGTIRRNGQAFKPSTNIPAGFVEADGKYEPSMAYLYSKSQPNIAAQPNRMFNYASGFTPATGNVYQQATGDLLSAPVSTPSYSGNYGAERFLNTGNLLGPTYGLQQQAGNYTSSYTPSSGYLTPPSVLFNRLNATNVPILNLFGTLGNAGALNNMSYTNSDTGFSGTVGEAQSASV